MVTLRPWRERPIDATEHAAISASVAAELASLQKEYQDADATKRKLEREDSQWRVIMKDASGANFAPIAMTDPDQPMKISQIVRMVDANALTTSGKLGVYLSRWGEFLGDDPREQNTDGGVFPVIFGTVLMTMLLSVIVVPFGVIAALYLREYARQGVVTSILRIAINNLAGVPSIVFGMFGLGFFCYTVGAYIDKGPEADTRSTPGVWWVWAAGVGVVTVAALVAALMARPIPGQPIRSSHRVMAFVTAVLWFVAAGAAVALAAHTPYFDGFFTDRPDSTFGKRGLLWASLTLALLTLPVVIVATEEAVAAVPRSMREGSYGCGASKWQTIRRIVLPGAMPGIMTGMILAMARGAGEVAPLMLVGAMKLAPELPFSSQFPFLHADRSFMHLGFHIFDLGFQSPDAEAARPLVWTTTLLLIAIVVTLNLSAIMLRARLKARGSGSAV
ncbi:MAG: phosphate ABC transporter permease PstA [Tepidisphaera sp.]